jgi:predicted nucleotidyltransferase
MLEDIVISRVRVKILTLFLSHPGVMYHVRDIVRKVDEEINAVRRELSHMEKAGMVSKEQRANRLFYLFRKDYPLYFELMELICKTTGIGADILKQKAKLGKLKYVMVSGRYIRGLPKRSQSDVDLVVVGTVVLPELSQVIKSEESRHEKEINYTVMTEEEFEFRKSRRDPFVISILTGSRIMVVGDEEDFVE